MNSAPPPSNYSASDTVVMRIMGGSTALAFAAVLGSAACVDRSASHNLVFRWRWTALIWMVLGAVAGWYLWHLVRVADDSHTPRARKRLMAYLVFLALGGGAVFVFPIIFVPAGQFREVLIGLLAAIAVLSFVGWMIFRLGRMFSGEETHDSGSDPQNKS